MNKVSYKNYHRDEDYQKFESMFANILQKRFDIISRYKKVPGKVLDIGASTGTFLQIFKDSGWEVWGIEPSESGEVAQRRGIRLIKTFFEKATLPKSYFDLVLMNHTLEHLDDPIAVLKKINSSLKKGGYLFIDVPNYGGLGSKLLGTRWPYLLPNEHLHQFTKDDLEALLSKTGFKTLHSESRSGLWEFADPVKELLISLLTLKKRFFTNVILFPYSTLATALNMGDSISVIGKKL